MKETKVRFEPDHYAQLEALADKSGHPVAALIRWCVKNSLPTLAVNIDRQIRNRAETEREKQ